MKNAIKTIVFAALLAVTAAGLSACHTVAGAGQDVSSVGHDVTNGATYPPGQGRIV